MYNAEKAIKDKMLKIKFTTQVELRKSCFKYKTVEKIKTKEQAMEQFPWLADTSNKGRIYRMIEDTGVSKPCEWDIEYRDIPPQTGDEKLKDKMLKMIGRDGVWDGNEYLTSHSIESLWREGQRKGSAFFKYHAKKMHKVIFEAVATRLLKEAGRI